VNGATQMFDARSQAAYHDQPLLDGGKSIHQPSQSESIKHGVYTAMSCLMRWHAAWYRCTNHAIELYYGGFVGRGRTLD
jgi:hypothetical protein